MTDKNQEAVIEQLMALDKRTLATRAAKQLGKYQKQIIKKDKLIADLTAQKSKAQLEADGIINEARQQARALSEEARIEKADAERRLQEAKVEADRKISNASAEADSIVETRLVQAKADIDKLEARRDEVKRSAIALNRNIISEYNVIADKITAQISGIKDMQERLRELSTTIESEDFKHFDVNDYVSTTVSSGEMPKSVVFSEDEDLLADDDIAPFAAAEDEKPVPVAPAAAEPISQPAAVNPEPVPEPVAAPAIEPDPDPDLVPEPTAEPTVPAPVVDDDFDFEFIDDDGDDFDFDLNNGQTQKPTQVQTPAPAQVQPQDDFDDFDFDDNDFGDTYSNGKAKSFTDAFMAVAPQTDDDDLDDFDFEDDLLDDDDDFDDLGNSAPQSPSLVVPQRPNRSQRKGGPARWL